MAETKKSVKRTRKYKEISDAHEFAEKIMGIEHYLFDDLTDLQRQFLHLFLDASNPKTFMKAEGCAQELGISSAYASTLKYVLRERISLFLAECGLDVVSLKAKLLELLHSRATRIYTVNGKFNKDDLPPHTEVLAEAKDKNGNTISILAVSTEVPELQRRALDMAIKMHGLYAPERVEHTGPEGGPIEFSDTERAARIAAILERARARRIGEAADGGDA